MKIPFQKKILLYAYGNPGRGDDGLGNAFIERIDQWIKEKNLQSISTDSSYQLNIEDAASIANFDVVVFVDASKANIDSYSFSKVQPEPQQTFTTHSVSPSTLVLLCQELYNKLPLVYLLQVKGFRWEFGEQLSEKALENLEKALEFAQKAIIDFQNQE